MHVLNGTAREIYLLCDGERTVADLMRSVLGRYEVDEPTAHGDVQDILQELLDLGLLSLS